MLPPVHIAVLPGSLVRVRMRDPMEKTARPGLMGNTAGQGLTENTTGQGLMMTEYGEPVPGYQKRAA